MTGDKCMTLEQLYKKLCVYDKRSPYCLTWSCYFGANQKPRDGCFCDNCFYGLDRLALEILRLKELVEEKERRLLCVDADKTLNQRVERAEAALEWQPIETAPRDGTLVLVYRIGGRIHTDCCNDKATFPYQRRWNDNPAYWMPLPSPPAAADAAKDTQ